MTTLPTSLFYVPVYPTHGDDALAEKGTEDPNAGQGISGGGNGIGTSVSGSYLFNSSTEIGDTSVEGLSVRNLTSLGTWMGAPAGIKWGSGPVGTGATLTYSFYVAGVSQYQEAEGQSPAFSFTPQQQSAAQMGMQSFANVANITFTQVTDTANSAGDIRWGNSTVPGTALAYFPGNSGSSGNVWFGTQYSDYAFPALGNYGYHTFIHELGHALGLAHPHSSTTNLPVPGHDRLQYSIMSYRGYTGQPLGSGYNLDYFPTTPMIDDIAALQAMYGANMSYNATNTVYSWAPGAKIFETIWDAGGIDLIDASNQTQGAVINLQPGTLSSVGASIWNGSTNMRDTLGIAYGAIIENATGSGFADIISGNSVANHLIGGGGNDTLRGFDGNDTLVGGTGNDSLEGGTGDDTYEVDAASDLIVEASNAGTDEVRINLGTGTYTLGNNVENAVLLPGAAAGLTGNALANHLAGNALSNTLNGGAGIDTLEGAAGDDTYEVDVAGDVIVEALGEGTDLVRVNLASGTYTLDDHVENATVISIAAVGITGNGLDNLLTGNAAANTLTGDAGNDTLNGAAGGDRLVGGLGDDKYLVDMASDVIVEAIGEGTDSVEVTFTAAGTYALSASVENATITNALNVNLTGSVDANVLTGGAGANLLSGAGGNDTLIGGLGKDTLDGGTGDDTAVLQGNRSDYTVTRTATEVVLTRSGQVVALRGIEQIVFDDTSLSMDNLLNNSISAFADTVVGTAGDDSIDGLAGDDSLSGLQGNDTLIGGTGIDTLTGGADNDTYHVDVAGDVIVEAFGEGTDFVQVGLGSGTYLLSGNIENATVTSVAAVGITGNGLDNLLTGNAAANTLTGDAGNDTLNGAAGGDRLVGGLGDDKYLVDMASDVIVEAIGEGTDSVEVTFTAAGTYALSASVENATITNALNVNLTGSVDANVLTGGAGANLLSGAGGNDTLIGGPGNDTLDGGADTDTVVLEGNFAEYAITRPTATDVQLVRGGNTTIVRNVENFQFGDGTRTLADIQGSTGGPLNDSLVGNADANTLDGGAGNDTVSGLAGNDTLLGGLGDDSLVGGEGDDSLLGGAGNDTYEVDTENDLVVEALNGGTDTVRIALGAGTYTLAANVENATIISLAAVGITGNALNNVLTGNGEANALSGAVGNDTLNGGAGNDTLDGGAGTDRLVGGLGDDTYVVDVATDVVSENAGEGTDEVQLNLAVAGTYTLGLNVENGVITTANTALKINLTGNGGNNVLTGNGGDNLLSGGAGDDTLVGGLGNDTLDGGTGVADRAVFSGNHADYTVARISATDTRLTHIGTGQVTIVRNVDVFEFSGGTTMTAAEVVANTAGIGNDTLSGTAQADLIDGLAGNDSLSGLAGNDTLKGGLGDDTLVGGEGDDSLEGGAGNDTYEVDSNADLVVEALSAGTDLVRVALTSGSYTLGVNVENATITSSAAVGLNGNALGNVLTGNDEANALSGAVGNDTLNGGAGNDTLDGGAGTDRLMGGLGDDTYMVDAGTDVIAELAGQGTDTVQVGFTLAGTFTLALNVENALVTNALNVNLTGNPDGNVLTGGAGANLLNGAGGNDTLIGGLGKDTLTGGTGSDRFEFSTAPSVGNVDTITDFVSGVDVIALSADIFTGLGVAGNTVGLSANLTYNSTTGVLAYDADGVGAGAPMQIALLGASTHPATLGSDFLLI